MDYIIGIDIGTGSTKAVAVDFTGHVLFTEQVSYPTLTPSPHVSEQAPELIWQAFVKSISRVVKRADAPPRALALSSAMHSVIPVDEQGQALMNMMTWADNRSAPVAASLKNSELGKKLYAETGTPIHAMSPLCKIIWLGENAPAVFHKTHKFISIKEYIWFRLFQQFEIDYSIASATGLFNIQQHQWHEEALSRCAITSSQLSTPVTTGFSRDTMSDDVAKQIGIGKTTPVIIGASDGCMANLGSFAITPGVAALTIGTSGAIRVTSEKAVANTQAMTFNYLLDDTHYICGGPINNGGVILKWYVQQFLKRELETAEDYDAVLDQLDQTSAGADGLVFLPYLLGDRAPIWNSDACGVFFGISMLHKQEHFTRAMLEGISMSLYHIANALESSGIAINTVHVSGGFVRSHPWLQLLADIFNKPIVLISSDDASATGAAFMAMKSLKIIASYADLKQPKAITFTPDPQRHRVYVEQNFPLYQSLYKNLVVDMAVWSEFQGAEKEKRTAAKKTTG